LAGRLRNLAPLGFELLQFGEDGRARPAVADRVDQVGDLAFEGGTLPLLGGTLGFQVGGQLLPGIVELLDEGGHEARLHQLTAQRLKYPCLQLRATDAVGVAA
jgi:hypothetical protein